MKAFLPFFICILVATHSFGQAPQQFSFQGVARNAAGQVVASTTVSLRLTILKNSAFGETVYRETHKPKTSQGGTFSVIVGTGVSDHGQFSDIDWKAASWFLRVEIDPAGGTGFVDMGTTQFLSVPFAIYANDAAKAANADKAVMADKADKALLADKALVADNAVHADSSKEATHAISADKFQDDKLIVLKGVYKQGEDLGTLAPSSALIWYPKKGAFRAGLSDEGMWNDVNTGNSSVAFNWATKASGTYSAAFGQRTVAAGTQSFAMGRETNASGENSFAGGRSSVASGYSSMAFGSSTTASNSGSISFGLFNTAAGISSVAMGESAFSTGDYSVAIGHSLYAKSEHSIAMGQYNDNSDNPNDVVPFRRLFQLGNGTASNKRSNALTVLQNGNIGLGKNALFPQYILDIDGRPRLRHNGQTAGLFLNTSQQNPSTFIGMKQDNEVGFFLGGDWRFWVDDSGVGYLNGALIQKSDRRLKKDLQLLSNSLSSLAGLNGYHYHWKDPKMSPALQTGLIAQEVEAIFPELVTTNKDGFKAVNYIGLIPHLIEAVKELGTQVQSLEKQNARLNEDNRYLSAQNSAMYKIEQRLNALEAKSGVNQRTTIPSAK